MPGEREENQAERTTRHKNRDEEVSKFVDEWIEKLPDQFYSADYLAQWRDSPVTVNFLSVALSRLRKRVQRVFLSELLDLSEEHTERDRSHRKRIQALETEVTALKANGSIDVEYDNERSFVIRRGEREFRFSLPVPIWRGLWRADARYKLHDMVTLAGGLWIAVENDPSQEPGQGTQWRLAVARGRNGRDANNLRSSQ